MLKVLMSLVCALGLGTAYAGEVTDSHAVSQAPVSAGSAPAASSSKALVLKPGQQSVVVNLPANVTTGYQWYVSQYDHSLLTLRNYRYLAPQASAGQPRLLGAPGTAEFTFLVRPGFLLAPQVTHIGFVSARAWDMDDSAQAATVTVVSVGQSADSTPQPAVKNWMNLNAHS